MMIKYPLHKVAKDFKKGGKDLPSKAVMDILTQYGHPPKNHMQPLTDEELSIVFEYLTQNNQIDSIESVYADIYHDPDAKKPAPSAPKAEVREQPKAASAGPSAPAPVPDSAASGQAAAVGAPPHHQGEEGGGYQGQWHRQPG